MQIGACVRGAMGALAIASACGPAAAAGPIEFSYEVAHFEVDGNALGPVDGG